MSSLPDDTDAYAESMTHGPLSNPAFATNSPADNFPYLDEIAHDHCSLPSLYSATPSCWDLVANPHTNGHIPTIMLAQDVRHLCFRKASTEKLATFT